MFIKDNNYNRFMISDARSTSFCMPEGFGISRVMKMESLPRMQGAFSV